MKGTRSQLLSKLITSKGEFVSGGLLSESLGVSRVSIKKHVDHLISDGFEIEAVRNKGYCLSKEPERLHEHSLRYFLNDSLPHSQLYCFETIDSTNTEVDRLLNQNHDAPVAVVAGQQLKGKGRRGNQWISKSGKNLYLSIGFRPNIEVVKIGQYTLWIGLCLAQFLKEKSGLDFQVKWPNDLYLSGRKVAGILTEAKMDMDHVQHLIVGFGFNINTEQDDFPDELKSKATSIRIESGESVRFNEWIAEIIPIIWNESIRYFNDPVQDDIQKKWPAVDFLKGKNVIAKGMKNEVKGEACGIDESGHLLIKLDQGEIYAVNSGEVTMAFD